MLRPVAVLLAGLAAAYAQTTQGLISGRVVDSITGAPLQGVEIVATGGSVESRQTASSDSGGNFNLPLLSPGMYHLRLALTGYQPQELYEQNLAVAGRLDYEFRLRPLGDVWERGETRSVFFPRKAVLPFFGPDVDLSRSGSFQATRGARTALESTLSDVIDTRELRALPLGGRDVYGLIVLQPGAVADAATGRGLGLAFNGQRPSASTFLLDGLENNNYLVSGPLAAIAPEAVEEYRVSTNNFSAEYGRSSGYLANVISRAGGNQWHGLAYLYWKNEALNANGFQQNAAGLPRPPSKETQPGFSAGGPLVADRLFASGAFEYLRFRSAADPANYRLPVPGVQAPGPIAAQLLGQYPATGAPSGPGPTEVVRLSPPSTLDRYFVLPRADYVAREGRQRFMVRAAIPRVRRPDFFWTPYRDFVTPLEQNTAAYAATAVLELRPDLTNEARAGWSSDDLRFDRPHPEIPSLSSADGTTLPGSPAFYSYRNRTRNLELVDNVVWSTGRHVFKFGGELLVRRLDGYLTAGRDSLFSFADFSAFTRDTPFTMFTALSRSNGAKLASSDYDREYRFIQSFFFAQDSFKVTPRLVLNYGIRYERFGAPVNTGDHKDALVELGPGRGLPERLAGATVVLPASGDQALYDADRNDFAPRAGFSWNVRRGGGTVVRGSYGIFYDRPFDNLWQNLRANDVLVPSFTIPGSAPVDYLAPVTGLLQTLQSFRLRTYSRQFPELTLYQPELRNGYVQSWFFGVQHQLAENLAVEMNALGALGRKLVTTDLVNRAFTLRPEDRPAANPEGRLNSSLANVSYRANQGASSYYALTASARYRALRGQFRAAYTWGHSIDNQSEPLAGEFFDLSFTRAVASAAGVGRAAFSRQFDSSGDRGNSDFDQRQSFVFSAFWEWRGWTIGALGALRTGLPYSVLTPLAFPPPVNGVPLVNRRADLVGDPVPAGAASAAGGRVLLDRAAFRAPASGEQGNTGRNAFRGPGLASADLSVGRAFSFRALGEAGRIRVRADAFNFLNHANLNNPDSFLGSPRFGIATYGRAGFASAFPALAPFRETARQIQLLFRLEF